MRTRVAEETTSTSIHTASLARALRRTFIAMLWITLGVYWCFFGIVLEFVWLRRPSDFSTYYAAAESLRFSTQAPIYHWQALAQTVAVHGGCPLLPQNSYFYPPLFAILLAPLTQLPCGTLLPAWHVFNLAVLGGTIPLLMSLLRSFWPERPRRQVAIVVVLISAFWLPIFWELWLGQVAILMLAGMLLSLWLQERDHPLLAGVVLGFITLIQVFPGILILLSALRGQWRVVAGAVLCGVCALALMLAVIGPTGVLSMTYILHSSGNLTQAHDNLGLTSVPLVGPVVIALAALGFVIAATRLPQASRPLMYGWAICTMVLVAPITWPFFLIWLLPVFVLCLGALPDGKPARWVYAALLAIYVFLDLATTIPHLATFGLVALWVFCGWLVFQSARGYDKEQRVLIPT